MVTDIAERIAVMRCAAQKAQCLLQASEERWFSLKSRKGILILN